ncbi:right-handed parallel beta-helix repeat-containing protein [Microbacterium sp. SSW1-49]|uniref:Right-handed parallel beta-helix repeat-containing protein n=1 Tax=Microbacterium croceum TaxID=2851645 RepID=A0ABT0FBL8_9MICO|nr:right-handed parallel beta-helix repeat-containing protein [Microbacterium croceum]MCK2035460.1 right-handed parallel beta-helix repeat-containing protein [Microbacterium croceum]
MSGTADEGVWHRQVPVSDDGGATLRAAIRDACEWTSAAGSRSAVIELAAGVHRIDPPVGDAAGAAIVISDASRVTLTAPQAELLFADPHREAISVRGSTDVVLDGFVLDYATPSFTQGVITHVDTEASRFRFAPAPGFPDFSDRVLFTGTGYGTLRDPRTGGLKPESRQTFMIEYAAEPAVDGSFLVTVEASDRGWMSHIEQGDGFVVGHRGDQHGIRIQESDSVTVRSVTIHAAPCAAILAHESSGTVLRDVTVARRTGSTRWISSNADAVHCQGGRRGPSIVGCRFEGMHDDGVNLYVHALTLSGLGERTLVLDGEGPVRQGDLLQLVEASTGTVLAEVEVAELVASEPRLVIVDRDLPASVEVGAAVYNRSNALPGFRIAGSLFHDFRGIGVRLKASGGVIEDCRFENLSGCGLWIANDPGWSEGPLGSRDVVVEGNTFRATPADVSLRSWPHSAATVMIELFDGADGPAAGRAHERIALKDNDIQQRAAAAVFVGGATDVSIAATRIDQGGDSWLATRDSDLMVI